MLFVGDLTYDAELLAAERVPGVGDRAGLHETTRRINQLATRFPGIPIRAAHDPAQEERTTCTLAPGRLRGACDPSPEGR